MRYYSYWTGLRQFFLKKCRGLFGSGACALKGVHRAPVLSRGGDNFALIGVGSFEGKQERLTKPFELFARVRGHVLYALQGRVAELCRLGSDDPTEPGVVLKELWEQGHRAPDFQAHAVARDGVRGGSLLFDEGCNQSAAKPHSELHDGVLPERGA